MTIKEAIDVLERSCDFHYEETDKCYGCLFENSGWCGEDFHEKLLALLKEQEAVKPKSKVRHGENAQYQHFCGNCMVMLHGKPKYCSNCGMKVKWE